MPTAIQTLKWRGFGVDRGDGFVEFRFGMIGLAFLRQNVWDEMRALRACNEILERENESLRGNVATVDRRGAL